MITISDDSSDNDNQTTHMTHIKTEPVDEAVANEGTIPTNTNGENIPTGGNEGTIPTDTNDNAS